MRILNSKICQIWQNEKVEDIVVFQFTNTENGPVVHIKGVIEELNEELAYLTFGGTSGWEMSESSLNELSVGKSIFNIIDDMRSNHIGGIYPITNKTPLKTAFFLCPQKETVIKTLQDGKFLYEDIKHYINKASLNIGHHLIARILP